MNAFGSPRLKSTAYRVMLMECLLACMSRNITNWVRSKGLIFLGHAGVLSSAAPNHKFHSVVFLRQSVLNGQQPSSVTAISWGRWDLQIEGLHQRAQSGTYQGVPEFVALGRGTIAAL